MLIDWLIVYLENAGSKVMKPDLSKKNPVRHKTGWNIGFRTFLGNDSSDFANHMQTIWTTTENFVPKKYPVHWKIHVKEIEVFGENLKKYNTDFDNIGSESTKRT